MNGEIKAAAERLIAGQYYGDGGNLMDAIQARKADGVVVANAYLADLAAREADLADRAKCINEEWLLSTGFTKSLDCAGVCFAIESEHHRVEIINGRVYLANVDNGDVVRIGTTLTTERGRMLDFLSSLKIELSPKTLTQGEQTSNQL